MKSDSNVVDLTRELNYKPTLNVLYIPQVNIMELYRIGLTVKPEELTFIVCDEISSLGIVNFYGSRYEAGKFMSVFLRNGVEFGDIKSTLERHFTSPSSVELANLNFWHSI